MIYFVTFSMFCLMFSIRFYCEMSVFFDCVHVRQVSLSTVLVEFLWTKI